MQAEKCKNDISINEADGGGLSSVEVSGSVRPEREPGRMICVICVNCLNYHQIERAAPVNSVVSPLTQNGL
ncbi:MAG: hypothetical protein DRI57_12880 [Deltaproteobacteria bacterium]|nr:MAG: hypothetical protein DRI57_12880 [Deltaproteobacteria bacterium]